MKTTLLLVAIFLYSFSSLYGQFRQNRDYEIPLPNISGWADNEHYIENRGQTEIMVNIQNGREKPYQRKAETKTPFVSIQNGDIFLRGDKGNTQLTRTPEKEINPVLSPDGKWVAFTRNNDLYALEISSGKEVRYTTDGSHIILNGYASWVYYEEILGRSSNYRSFWWSPDSKHIAFFRYDDTQVPMFPIYNSSGQHGYLEETRYPKAGDPNPEVQIGIAAVDGGTVIWSDFNSKEDQYFGQPFWTPDGSKLLVQWMPREQNKLKIYEINPLNGSKKEIYDEKQPTWIDWISSLHWLKNGFLIVRDFDGWEQIYYHGNDGRLKHQLTKGNNWHTQILKIDEAEQMVYYTSCGERSTRTDLYRVQLNGKNQKRLTFGEYTHNKIMLSPDNRHFTTVYANTSTPPRLALVNTKTGKTNILADAKGAKFDEQSFNFPEMVHIKTPDGLELPGRVTWPSTIEEGKKYPVIIQIYGGPNAGTVKDYWTPIHYLENAGKDGIIQIAIDHRGSGHCGKKGMNYLHRNLGKWEMEDYISWVKWLREKPFVNPDKIMIMGGSYGGYITALALTYGSEYFQYGISQFPVIDWMLYDSHYTERYMDHPKDNPEGYKFASVLTHASNYQTKGDAMLRLEHGTMDDNVHMQNTIQFIDLLQNLNKSFEFMLFPNERHGWYGPKSAFTNAEIRRFIQRHLLQ